ncbi:MAG: bifunctional hydroxymethylpyrimidine kinase/phosphomethylpyrimidine kinase [Melioribacter sp.]|nr:bifunctional hydroxymethylpyrimidine kinase/phosphomethylpyrimidine kinase [Melioribacter sp.]
MSYLAKALTIAGSDSSAGAGIQADLKTFMALNVYGTTAVTSITAQNTKGVESIFDLPGEFVYKQIESVVMDIDIAAVKTGMLSNSDIVRHVAKAIKDFKLEKLIIDPVMLSKSGSYLLRSDSIEIFKEKLLPYALVITPNKMEAEVLSEIKINSKEEMIKAAEKIYNLGAKYVIVKGGHISYGNSVLDLILTKDKIEFLEYQKVNTKNTHGIGCTFSAAITAYIAKGFDVLIAIKKAREFIQNALNNEIQIGKGFGPLNHRWLWKE